MKNSSLLKSVRRFFRTVLQALTDIRFFRTAQHHRVSQVLGYLSVLLIVSWLIPFSINFFIGVRSTNDALISGLRHNVPLDAQFILKDGAFTTNLEKPIVLEKNGITFIMNSASSSLALAEDDIGISINRDAIVQREGLDEVRIVNYSEFPEFELDRSGVEKWIVTFGPWIIFLVSVVTIVAFSLITVLGFGAFILLHTFIFSIVMRLFKQPLPYTRAFAIAGYAATIPILLKAAADWSGTNIGAAPTLLYWLLLAFVIYDFRRIGREMSAKNPQ